MTGPALIFALLGVLAMGSAFGSAVTARLTGRRRERSAEAAVAEVAGRPAPEPPPPPPPPPLDMLSGIEPAPPVLPPVPVGHAPAPAPPSPPDPAAAPAPASSDHPVPVPAAQPRRLWAPPSPALAEAMANVPKRRREDFLPEAEDTAPASAVELPEGYRDPVTGLPLAEAIRHDIEMRAADFKIYSVVVCQPMRAMTAPGGAVHAATSGDYSGEEIQTFAGVLKDSLRQKDMVGRYNEQLFVLFLSRCRVDETRIVLERIRNKLLVAQAGRDQWIDVTYGTAAGTLASVDEPLRSAYADLLERNAGTPWFVDV